MRSTSLPLLLAALLQLACNLLGDTPPADPSRSLPPASHGPLAEAAERALAEAAPGESALLPVTGNAGAMELRLALVDSATTSIDAQYFIWQADEASALLFTRLLAAADRGVRVRLIVDDIFLTVRDRGIAAISAHPNFEMRIFNPGRVRNSRLGGLGEFLLYFRELNRRMHNKLLVADGRAAVLGGRNIGNPYFGLADRYNFRDLDVLVMGPVLEELGTAFDEYWNAPLAYPGAAMSPGTGIEELPEVRARVGAIVEEGADRLAAYPAEPADWTTRLSKLPDEMMHGEAHFLQDDPMGDEEAERLLTTLTGLIQGAEQELLVVSPYLIPTRPLLDYLAQETAAGVRVRLLTASMGANNHTAAHSHYKKYRRQLLDKGSELYEFRHDPSEELRAEADVPPVEAEFVALHTKALVVDRRRCFIGSLNLDPRALEINTENGLYVESPGLCAALASRFEHMMEADNAWRVERDGPRGLRWSSSAGSVTRQPARSTRQRLADFLFQWLPIESQL